MMNILNKLFKRIQFKHEFLNLLSFFVGLLASSAMLSCIIYRSYSWAIFSGIVGWLGFTFLLKRHKEVIYQEITLKLLRKYDQDKVKDVLEIIREQE